MKKLIVTTLFLLLCTVFALAQTSGTQSSNPTSQTGTGTSSGSTGQEPSTAAPSTSSQTGSSGSQDTMGTSKSQSSASTKGEKEKKITGCLESSGSGQYVVKHKNKDITVVPSSAVSSEIASHVGHKVKLYGTWEEGAGGTQTAMNSGSNLPQSDQPSSASGSSTKGAAGDTSATGTSGKADKADKGAKEFRAEKIEMVSDSCGSSDKSKPDTGTTPKPN